MILIFDLDGTLLNTITDLGIACNHTLAQAGFPTHDLTEYPHLVGNGVNRLIWRALPEEHRTDEQVLALRPIFTAYYDKHNTVHTAPYPGIKKLLHELKNDGHKLAVASNKYDKAAAEIVEHYFPNIFATVMGERTGVERKPSRQVVDNILNELKTAEDELGTAEKIVYIGDSLVDVETARNAEVQMIACTWGFEKAEALAEARPDFIVSTADEIYKIISTLQ